MNRIHNHSKHILLFLLLAAVYCSGPVFAQVSEYMVKAAFLERFSRFVEWPSGSDVHDLSSPFVIAVIGENPFDSTLDKLYASQKIKNKEVKIRYIKTPEEIRGCDILFISSSCKNVLKNIIAITRDKPILTVGDTRGFSAQDVHINLYTENDDYPFEINVKAVRKAGLTIDYHLLELAKVVE